jgi:acetaldehyde dehydrogenase
MLKVAIIGTGQIGFDLLHKIQNLSFVEIVAFVGRRPSTKILPNNINYSDKSIDYFILNQKCCDVVFDCTDAYSAVINSKVFYEQNIKVIDLTPSNIGNFYIPTINLPTTSNINMVTCGGQVSIPLLNYINNKIKNNILYAEIVTQINSKSAGMATRINIDKYIETTENAIYQFIKIPKCKVILNVNPNINTTMQTTLFIKTNDDINISEFYDIEDFANIIKDYIKNYKIEKPLFLNNKLLMFHITITSSGDVLSKYAGNLDIINCAAVHALKHIYNEI